jgi:release factor glutamine methyltransferase
VKGEAATVASLLDDASARIAATIGLEKREARLEARVLAAFAWQVDRAWLIAHDTDLLGDPQVPIFQSLLARRLVGEPVAYILGEKEFYGRMFKVTPDVLIPRPETELLVETALKCLPNERPARILDIGTGSGCIALSLALERPDCSVTAVDLSARALTIAQENAHRLHAQAQLLHSNLFDSLGDACFDLIISNPPYIPASDPHLRQGDVRFEPKLALTAGAEGLDTLKPLVWAAPHHLVSGGWLMLEHGWDQQDSCHSLLVESGFMKVQCLLDLAGHGRLTLGQWMGK